MQEKVVSDPIETIRDALATYGGVTPTDVQFQGDTGAGGTFTFTAAKTVKPTESGVNAALGKTELRGQTVEDHRPEPGRHRPRRCPRARPRRSPTRSAKYAGASKNDVSISTVGPTWGHSVSKNAERALVYFFILLALYLSVRFEAKMAAAAIIAVIHDIIFTVGVYSLFHFQVTPATITAFLTILGFSLYDTVVVFDKVRENQRVLTSTGRSTYGEMVNKSLNQVLMRSLSTSFVALMPVLSLLIVGTGVFGATSLEDFALALAAGLFIGSYSSIFVAAPILAWWKEREPQYRNLVERRARSGGQPLAAAAAPARPRSAARPAPAMAGGSAGRSRRRGGRRRARRCPRREPRRAGPTGRGPHHPAPARASSAGASASRGVSRRLRPTRRYPGGVADTSSLRELVRDIPDWPKPGIVFRDITPLLAAPDAFALTVDELAAPFADEQIDKVLGIEARGLRVRRARWRTAGAPGSCRCARPASCPGRSSARSTPSSTAPTSSRCTATRCARASGCSSSTT